MKNIANIVNITVIIIVVGFMVYGAYNATYGFAQHSTLHIMEGLCSLGIGWSISAIMAAFNR